MYTCLWTLFACFLLASLFVGSLYVWSNPLNRDHPDTIKKRFISVLVATFLSPFITVYFLSSSKLKSVPLNDLLGFRLSGLIPAIFLPLLLTIIFFAGPISVFFVNGLWRTYLNINFLKYQFSNLIWWRNQLVAPFSEEFTFRACMMPLLVQCFEPLTAVFVCPLFFGIAHVHHMIERLSIGFPLRTCLILAIFEFSYTTLFGAYSALLFVKTGHFVAPFLAHSFCNMMGFPDFNEILLYTNPKRILIISIYVAGVVLWYILLAPFTNHTFFENYVYELL